MSFDLAISEAGDLTFSPAADLSGISGTDLVEQRMLIRLKLVRGSWTYDDSNSLGSQLHKVMSVNPLAAPAQAEAYVREALRDMTDIEIDGVAARQDGRVLTLLIDYHMTSELLSLTTDQQQLEFAILPGGIQ